MTTSRKSLNISTKKEQNDLAFEVQPDDSPELKKIINLLLLKRICDWDGPPIRPVNRSD